MTTHFCIFQENREYTAEVMFETFNVPGMYIATQAVLCLYANELSSGHSKKVKPQFIFLIQLDSGVSGVVVDAGEGGTSIIPVVCLSLTLLIIG